MRRSLRPAHLRSLLGVLIFLGTVPETSAQGGAAALTVIRDGDTPAAAIRGISGLTFSPQAGALLVLRPGAKGPQAVILDPAGKPKRGVRRLPEEGIDLVNAAFDPKGRRLLLLDGKRGRIVTILADQKGWPASSQRKDYDARALGVSDPRGIAIDADGRLFILDAAGPRLIRVDPGPDGGFDVSATVVVELRDLTGIPLRGLAVHPGDGHLHALNPVDDELIEVGQDGAVIASRDLRALGVRHVRAFTFAPSADETDDAARSSLYVVAAYGPPNGVDDLPGAQLLELAFAPARAEGTTLAVAAAVPTFTSSLVRTTQTSGFNPPSPDPSGITYLPWLNHLWISDAEVEEMSIYQNVNVWETTLAGTVVSGGTYKVTSFTNEPSGVGSNSLNRHLFYSDDDRFIVHEVNAGPDGRFHTSDDIRTSFKTSDFGSDDNEDVAFDTSAGVLWVTDGKDAEEYRVSPGANGVFDGVPPAGDDTVTHFDVAAFGVTDPEGIAFNGDNGTLYIVGKPATLLIEVTTSGALVRNINISAAGAFKPAGIAYGPASNGSGEKRLYIVDRNVDNGTNPNENDGKLYEMSLPGAATPTPAATATRTPTRTPTPAGTPPATATPSSGSGDFRVNASGNDAEEHADGVMDLTSTDLEMTLEATVQTVGMRFTSVSIPKGAQIAAATVQFQADETSSTSTALTIRGEASDNPSAFTATAGNITSRPLTASSAAWSPPAWDTVGEAGAAQRTTDLAAVVHEIVNRPGWSSGNALVLIVNGSGKRVAESFDGDVPGAAPLLHVVYNQPTPTPPPTAIATATPTWTSTPTAPAATATATPAPPTATPSATPPPPTATPSRTPTATPTAPANYVGNPGFESNTAGWDTSGSGVGVTLSRVAGGHSGGFAARLATSKKNKVCILNDQPNWVTTTTGGQFIGRLWVRADVAGATLTLRFREFTGTTLRGSNTDTVQLSTGWQQITVTYTAIAPGSSTLDFNAYVNQKTVGTCFYADDAAISRQ